MWRRPTARRRRADDAARREARAEGAGGRGPAAPPDGWEDGARYYTGRAPRGDRVSTYLRSKPMRWRLAVLGRDGPCDWRGLGAGAGGGGGVGELVPCARRRIRSESSRLGDIGDDGPSHGTTSSVRANDGGARSCLGLSSCDHLGEMSGVRLRGAPRRVAEPGREPKFDEPGSAPAASSLVGVSGRGRSSSGLSPSAASTAARCNGRG